MCIYCILVNRNSGIVQFKNVWNYIINIFSSVWTMSPVWNSSLLQTLGLVKHKTRIRSTCKSQAHCSESLLSVVRVSSLLWESPCCCESLLTSFSIQLVKYVKSGYSLDSLKKKARYWPSWICRLVDVPWFLLHCLILLLMLKTLGCGLEVSIFESKV